MKEEENIAEHLLRVDEIVNTIKGIGEELYEKVVVQKVLRSPPMGYDPKVFTLEDRENIEKPKMDELHGIITAYEMRTGQEKPSKGENEFEASKGTTHHEHVSNENNLDRSDEEEVNFIKKLKKVSRKYKGKLPFKCFNCGKIGHFASKFSYPKEKYNDDEEYYNQQENKNGKSQYKNKFNKKKKNFCSKEDNISFEKSEDDDTEVLLMGI
jgi:hypothetical protein